MVGDQMNRVQFRFIFSNGRKIFLTMIRWQIASRDFSSTSELWFPLSLSLSLFRRERESLLVFLSGLRSAGERHFSATEQRT